jgi:hypothetical protein
MTIGRHADLAAIEKYKIELAQLEAMGPVQYPDPRAERIARLRSTISSLDWSVAHAFYGLED